MVTKKADQKGLLDNTKLDSVINYEIELGSTSIICGFLRIPAVSTTTSARVQGVLLTVNGQSRVSRKHGHAQFKFGDCEHVVCSVELFKVFERDVSYAVYNYPSIHSSTLNAYISNLHKKCCRP